MLGFIILLSVRYFLQQSDSAMAVKPIQIMRAIKNSASDNKLNNHKNKNSKVFDRDEQYFYKPDIDGYLTFNEEVRERFDYYVIMRGQMSDIHIQTSFDESELAMTHPQLQTQLRILFKQYLNLINTFLVLSGYIDFEKEMGAFNLQGERQAMNKMTTLLHENEQVFHVLGAQQMVLEQRYQVFLQQALETMSVQSSDADQQRWRTQLLEQLPEDLKQYHERMAHYRKILRAVSMEMNESK
jgi:hypothetical protein